MTTQTCPRCGATLPPDAQWEPLDLVDGRAPAYRNRHERPGGQAGDRKCVVYSGELAETNPRPTLDEGSAARELCPVG